MRSLKKTTVLSVLIPQHVITYEKHIQHNTSTINILDPSFRLRPPSAASRHHWEYRENRSIPMHKSRILWASHRHIDSSPRETPDDDDVAVLLVGHGKGHHKELKGTGQTFIQSKWLKFDFHINSVCL